MADNKYYWLKLKRDFFKRHDIQIIEDIQPNGKEYVLFYLKLMVESIDHEGELRFSDTIPYNASMLATITRTNPDIVRSALKVLAEFGMIDVLDDQTIYMTAVENLIGSAANNDHAKRQQRYRERQKQLLIEQKNGSVTKSDASVTVCDRKSDESKSKSIDIEIEEKNKKKSHFVPPTLTEVQAYIFEKGYSMKAEEFVDFYQSKDWMVGRNKMKDWQASVRNWERREKEKKPKKGNTLSKNMQHDYDMEELKRRAKE